MKAYDMNKIIQQVKEEKHKSKAIKSMINHLMPSNVKELNKCITINNILDNNY